MSADNFMPHGHCFLWQRAAFWLNVGSDALIAGSDFAIPLTIFSFTRQKKANALLQTIVESAPASIYAKDREGRMLLANPPERGVVTLRGMRLPA